MLSATLGAPHDACGFDLGREDGLPGSAFRTRFEALSGSQSLREHHLNLPHQFKDSLVRQDWSAASSSVKIHRSAVELFPYSEGGRDGAGGPVLPRRRSRGNLAVACFTRNAFRLAANYET